MTCFALLAATVGIRTGNRAYTNNMFRLRGNLNKRKKEGGDR
ncbi:MAG: HIG1 domain-containing protein [Paenibacillus sp.]|nr:HIG1 domain-containing protein [Paenibacillus sp.]